MSLLFAVLATAAASIPLPADAPISIDYLAVDLARGQIWVPANNTGKTFVVDAAKGSIRTIDGFVTAEGKNGKRSGPTSASVGDGVVYVGNRGDSSICAYDAVSLAKKGCATVPSTPDGTVYVAPAHQVWVTTPREKSLQILDVTAADAPKLIGKIELEGEPEGYAVDEKRGLFFTNLEDKDRTLAIDVKSHRVISDWAAGCGEAGPRGLALDEERHFLFVACTDAVLSLDARTGKRLGRVETGKGVDNIDYLPARGLVYAAAGAAAQLTIAHVGKDGALTVEATVPLSKSTRVVVVTKDGDAFAADPAAGRLLHVRHPAKSPQ